MSFNAIANMSTNKNNTRSNKEKETDMQTKRRSPRFNGSGEIGGKVISPDGAADGQNGTGGTGSGIGSGNGGEVPPTVNAGGPPLPESPQRKGREEGGGNSGNGGSEKQQGGTGRSKTAAYVQ